MGKQNHDSMRIIAFLPILPVLIFAGCACSSVIKQTVNGDRWVVRSNRLFLAKSTQTRAQNQALTTLPGVVGVGGDSNETQNRQQSE